MMLFSSDKADKATVDLLIKEFSEFQKICAQRDAKMDAHMTAEELAFKNQNSKIDSIIRLIEQGNKEHKLHSEKLENDLIDRLDRDYYTSLEVETKMVELKNCCRSLFVENTIYEAKILERDKELVTVKLESKTSVDNLKTMLYVTLITNAGTVGGLGWIYLTFIKNSIG